MHLKITTFKLNLPQTRLASMLAAGFLAYFPLPSALAGVSTGSGCPGGALSSATGFDSSGNPTGWASDVAQQDCSNNVAIGTNSHAGTDGTIMNTAINSATANGYASTAVGYSSAASGETSTAIGYGSAASGQYSTATGTFSWASGVGATATGFGSTAAGRSSIASGLGSLAMGYASTATGSNSTAIHNGDIAMGGDATTNGSMIGGNIAIGSSTGVVTGNGNVAGSIATAATGGNSIAIGTGTQSTGNNSVAIGAGSTDGGVSNVVSVGSVSQTRTVTNVTAGANTTDAVNFGQLQAVMTQLIQSGICTVNGNSVKCASAAAATNAVQVGNNASAGYNGAIAIGNGAQITAPTIAGPATGAVAIGNGAQANADPSVAIGNNANANGANAVAVGDTATATGLASTALGYQATTTGTNSVAIGAGSTDGGQANVVSVGAAGAERRITHIAPGVAGTDAVNVDQLNSALNNLAGGSISAANAYTDQQVGQLRTQAFRGIAQAAAMVGMAPAATGETTVNVGFASYGGEQAGSLAVAHRLNDRLTLNAGLGFAGGSQSLVRVGASFRF